MFSISPSGASLRGKLADIWTGHPQLFFVACCTLVYWVVAMAIYPPGPTAPLGTYITKTLAIALLGCWVTYKDLPATVKILLRSAVVIAIAYVAISHVAIPEALVPKGRFEWALLNYGWVAVCLLGILGLVRPSFAIIPLQAIFWYKLALSDAFGTIITHIDYFTLIDTGTYVALGIVVYAAMLQWRPGLVTITKTERSNLHCLEALVLAAVAMHFGNYFYSWAIKAALGPNPFFWITESYTPYLSLAALESGVLPMSFSEALTGKVYEGFAHIYALTNAATYVGQFLAIVAIIRIRWTIWVTLFYDAMHLGIFILTGIFFWKFILLNLAIVAALTPIRQKKVGADLRIGLVLLVGLSIVIFKVTCFGWLDSRSMNYSRFIAVADGKEYEVPSNYFLGLSVTFAQNRLVWPKDVPFATETWGAIYDYNLMRKANACTLADDPNGNRYKFLTKKEDIVAIVQRHHALVLSLTDQNGLIEYNMYPHHIWSVPWRYADFHALDKRRIATFKYVSEAVCLGFEGGKLQRDVKWHGEFDIPVSDIR